jgi:hypothetical protein
MQAEQRQHERTKVQLSIAEVDIGRVPDGGLAPPLPELRPV